MTKILKLTNWIREDFIYKTSIIFFSSRIGYKYDDAGASRIRFSTLINAPEVRVGWGAHEGMRELQRRKRVL